MSFANKEDAKEWMIKQQLGRRNLTKESIAYYRGQLYNTMKNKVSNRSGENQYTIGEKAEVRGQSDPQAGIENQDMIEKKESKTADVLGKEYRVGSKTIKRDGDYAKAIDILNGTIEDPEFIGSILTKKIRLSRIDAGKLAKIAEEHSDIVKESYNRGKSGKEWRNKVESKIKKINLKTPDKFPYFENDVVVIRSNEGSGSEIKVLSGRWGIVNKVGEFSCEVKVCNGLLEDVRAEELEGVKLSDEDKESAIALMGRLQKLAEIEIVDELVNEIIWGIGKKEKIKLTPLQNEILTLIEKRLNRLED